MLFALYRFVFYASGGYFKTNRKSQNAASVWAGCIVWLGILLATENKYMAKLRNAFFSKNRTSTRKTKEPIVPQGQYYGAKENNLDLAVTAKRRFSWVTKLMLRHWAI
jgi:hypothetical protein